MTRPLPPAPGYPSVNPNLQNFRDALGLAGAMLAGRPLAVYSRHKHFDMSPEAVLFEERVNADTLTAYPVSQEDAIRNDGLPSCWGVSPDGTVVVLRYAAREFHQGSDIDVKASDFLAELAEAGHWFAQAGLHRTLELNVASQLFGKPGLLTFEETDMQARRHRVTFVPPPREVLAGDWRHVSCWGFTDQGKPVVKGFCGG